MVKHPGHAPEALATPGTADPNGIYVHAGYDSDITETGASEHEDTGLFTSYDLVASSLIGLTYNFGLTYKAIDDILMKWSCNLPAGAGTIAQTKTFLYSQLIDSIEKYKLFKGCLPQTFTCRITKQMVQCTIAGRASVITDFLTTSTLTSPTLTPLTVKPTTQPWTGKDTTGTAGIGVYPLTIAGTPMPVMEFTWTVNWNLAELTPLGLVTYQEIGPSARRITMEFVTYRKGDNFLADLNSYTPVTVDMKVHAGSGAAQVFAHFVDCYKVSYTPVGNTVGGGDYTTERIGMIAMSMNVANT